MLGAAGDLLLKEKAFGGRVEILRRFPLLRMTPQSRPPRRERSHDRSVCRCGYGHGGMRAQGELPEGQERVAWAIPPYAFPAPAAGPTIDHLLSFPQRGRMSAQLTGEGEYIQLLLFLPHAAI